MRLYIPLFLFLLVGFSASGQKSTGGCGYAVKAKSIGNDTAGRGGILFTLYNGAEYTAVVEYWPTHTDFGQGYIIIKIDTYVLAEQLSTSFYGQDEVKLKKINFAVGSHPLFIKYEVGSCSGYWSGTVIIKDPVETDTVMADTVAVEPYSQPDTLAELSVSPMPVSGNSIVISGLRPSETDCFLRITDMQGMEVGVNDISKNNSSITIPIKHIPNGIYAVRLRTAQRDVIMRVQVLK